MWNMGWKSIARGLILLLDIIVFADLVRAEFAYARARRGATKHRQLPTAEYHPLPAGVMDRGRTAAS